MLERERERELGAESNGKLPHLFIPDKTAALVPEFAMEDLPLGTHDDDMYIVHSLNKI